MNVRYPWAAILVIGAALGAAADDREDVIKASRAWATALVDGDAKALRATSSGPETELARWEAMGKMFASFQKLTDAVTAKYGEQADLSKMFMRPDFGNVGDAAKVEVAGNDATITNEGGKSPTKLKREGGQWKVVLASFPEVSKLEPKQMIPMTEAVSSTADEIKAGKHATYPAAMKALGTKMAKLKAGGK
jgi:hypothetical protein